MIQLCRAVPDSCLVLMVLVVLVVMLVVPVMVVSSSGPMLTVAERILAVLGHGLEL